MGTPEGPATDLPLISIDARSARSVKQLPPHDRRSSDGRSLTPSEIGAPGVTRTPAGSLGSSCPSPKFSLFQARPRAWQGHGVPGPPQQRVKLVGVPRCARDSRGYRVSLALLACGGWI